MRPTAVAEVLVYAIAIWAMATGLLEIVAAVRLQSVIDNAWLMGLSGVLSIVFGALVLAQPGTGALALVYLFGFYAVLSGISQISLGFRVRGLGSSLSARAQSAPSQSR